MWIALASALLGSSVWAGGFGFGFLQGTRMDPAGLNTFLRNNGQPELERKLGLDLGGGGYFMKGSLLIGVEGGSISMAATRSAGKKVTLGGGYLTINGGYGLWRSGGNLIYANAGLGYSAMSIDIKEASGTFDTYKIRSLDGIVGKVGIAYLRKIHWAIVGTEAGIIQPLSGLEADGNRLGTTIFIRLLLGGGAF